MAAFMSTDIETLQPDQEKKVDISRLYEELHAFWKTVVGPKKDMESEAVTRACLHNLIIYTERQQIVEALNETIVKITLNYPCRIIVLHAEPDSPTPSLDAWFSAHCHL